MKTNLLIWTLCASLFFVSCNSSDNGGDEPPLLTIDEIEKLPYSELTPDQQKTKLEKEGIAFIDMANALKTSTSVEAYQTLADMLETSTPELLPSKRAKKIEETILYADAYGIYTWDAAKKDWTKTVSDKELKFIFPSKKSGKTNDAELSVTAESSGISVIYEDEDYSGYWDSDKGEWIDTSETTEYTYYLPSSAKAALTVSGKEVATITLNAEYQGKNEIPVKVDFLTKLADGYELSAKFDKATTNVAESYLKYNNTTMLSAKASSNIKIDEIFQNAKDDKDPAYAAYGTAEAYIKVLNNLAFVATGDMANYIKESEALDAKYEKKWDEFWRKDYLSNKNYYTEREALEKGEVEENIALFSKYMNVILAATNEDAHKIAKIVQKAEINYTYDHEMYWDETEKEWQNAYRYEWNESKQDYDKITIHEPDPKAVVNYYEIVDYLQFNDNTLVEMDTYFSKGFTTFTDKWDAFVKAFNR